MKHFTLRLARTTSSSFPIFFQEPLFAFLWINLICFYSTPTVACLLYVIRLFWSDVIFHYPWIQVFGILTQLLLL